MSNPFKDWTPAMIEAHNAKILARQGDKGLHAPTRKVLGTRQGLTPDGPLSSVLAKERTHENHYLPSNPIPKQTFCDGPLATKSGEGKDAIRFTVRIKSFRRKLLDPDNLTGGVKYFVDGLRYAGILPDDTPDKITLEVSQEKVKENERTEIEII